MQQLFSFLLVLHVSGGTLGLICGTIATAVVKGRKAHILTGKIYFYAMLVAAVSALVMSNLPNHHSVFLFAVGGFTLYMISSGYRVVWLKRNLGKTIQSFTWVDYAIALFALVFGIFLVVLAVTALRSGNTFGLVPAVFGLISLNYARLDYKLFSGKQKVKQVWIVNHITRMMGALIASYTAFLVVNVHIQMQWILWLLPTAVGSTLIYRFLQKFAPNRNVKQAV